MKEWPTRVRIPTPAVLGDDLGHHVGADQVVEDGRAGVLVQHRAATRAVVSEPDTGSARSSTRKHPVGVAVEGQPDVGPRRQHGRLQVDQVLGLDGVGRMVGEGAVELAEQDLDVEGQAGHDQRDDQPAHAVGRVGHHLAAAAGRPGRRTSGRGRRTRRAGRWWSSGAGGRPAAAGSPGARRWRPRSRPARCPGRSGRAPARQSLIPLYCGRVVRGGEHGARGRRGGPEAKYKKSVEAMPEVGDRRPLGPGPLGEGRGQLDPRRAHVPGHQQPGGPGEPGHGAADGPAQVGVELVGHGAPDVVGLEDVSGGPMGGSAYRGGSAPPAGSRRPVGDSQPAVPGGPPAAAYDRHRRQGHQGQDRRATVQARRGRSALVEP